MGGRGSASKVGRGATAKSNTARTQPKVTTNKTQQDILDTVMMYSGVNLNSYRNSKSAAQESPNSRYVAIDYSSLEAASSGAEYDLRNSGGITISRNGDIAKISLKKRNGTPSKQTMQSLLNQAQTRKNTSAMAGLWSNRDPDDQRIQARIDFLKKKLKS